MKLVKKILDWFSGLQYPQEYLCFAKGTFYQPLHVYIVDDSHILSDVTNHHLFVGYCPLVFAFSSPGMPESLRLFFSHQLLKPNESYDQKDALALLDLRLIKTQSAGGDLIWYYEGVNGNHQFIPRFNQFMNQLNNNWFNKKPGNVFLHNNLYRQVQIAYAVPRTIALITVEQDGLFNLFPTDLHGQVDAEHYIISLRVGGKALEQVEKAGRILLSEVRADAYKIVYGLGKNHMQEPRPREEFPFAEEQHLAWPLPQQAIAYRELALSDSFMQGIHKILLFRITAFRQTGPVEEGLVHIHNSYATWRSENGLAGNYLLR